MEYPCQRFRDRPRTRRQMLRECGGGFGAVALSALLGDQAFADAPGSALHGTHFPARAKRIIFLYMDGGPSQVDTFDPKPMLTKYDGQDPGQYFKVEPTQFNNNGKVLASPWQFQQHGEAGIPVSDLFPQIAQCADELAVVRSMISEFPEHTFANYFLHPGSGLQGRPSMGAWVNYGLGTENSNLPGYVVLDGGLIPPGGVDNFKNGFLPADYQASLMKTGNTPVANIKPDSSFSGHQKQKLDFIKEMDRREEGKSDEIEAAIKNYELAYH